MSDPRQPRFIALEGLDGAGTTTQSKLVGEAFSQRGRHVLVTAEPTDGELGRITRLHIEHQLTLDVTTATLAFLADRADHLSRTIVPALGRGQDVICDRYLLSTLAYQGASGADQGWILEIARPMLAPVTIFLDVPPLVAQARLDDRTSRDRYEAPELAAPIRHWYLRGIELLRSAGQRVEIIDATLPPDEICRTIVSLVLE